MTWDASIFAAAAAGASAVAAITLAWNERRHDVRADMRSAVEALSSGPVLEARSVVGSAARQTRLSRREREEFRDAAFTLMWTLQAIQFQRPHIRRSSFISAEASILYGNVDVIMRDLRRALEVHGDRFDWCESGMRTDAALDRLPEIRGRWRWCREVRAAPSTRLR